MTEITKITKLLRLVQQCMYKYKHMNIQSDHYCESQQRLLFRQRSTNHTTQWFETYMKVKYCTGAVVMSLHCKHKMFTYISVSHKYTSMHCIISHFHTNIKATAPY